MLEKQFTNKLFSIPSREKRSDILDSGLLKKIQLHEAPHKSDPDFFIFTILLRRAIGLSFVFAIIVYFWALALPHETILEHTSLFHFCESHIFVTAPFSIALVTYHFMLYRKNVDINKYNPLIDRTSGEKAPNAFIVSAFLFPLTFLAMLMPGSFAYNNIYDTDTLSFLSAYYNSRLFILFTLLFWGIALNSMAIFLCFLSSVILNKTYFDYRQKINTDEN